MNWLYFIVMAYIVISALRGFHKGFIKVIYSIAAIFISVVFVALAAPQIGRIIDGTAFSKRMEAVCEDYVREQVSEKLSESNLTDMALPWLNLPKKIQREFKNSSKTAAADIIEQQGIYKKAAKTITDFIINLIASLAALLIISLILFIIGRKLDMFSKTPGINIANMVMGFIAGAAKAFLVIWIVFLIIKVTAVLPPSSALVAMIEENAVLKNLYDQNRVLELLQYLTNNI